MRPILIALIAIAVLPTCVFGQDDRLVITRDANDPARYICDVKFATFKSPRDWRPNRSDKNTYAILTRIDEAFPHITSMISIDIGKPVEPTAELTAAAFAKKWKGKVLEKKIIVDGEEGYRVKAAANDKDVRPVDCVVVAKGKRVFMVIGGAKESEGIESAIDEVIESWKWKQDHGEENDSQ